MTSPGHDLKTATLSPDGRYRYHLARRWDGPDAPAVVWVMLNPSTADAYADDPTIRKCRGFTERFGETSMAVVNLYAYRATNPRDLPVTTGRPPRPHPDAIGPECDAWVLRATGGHVAAVVAAWGEVARVHTLRAAQVLQMLVNEGHTVWRLGAATRSGQPRHPLYASYDTPLEVHR